MKDNHSTAFVRQISECFIKPNFVPEESKQPYFLNPWDLTMLSVHYIQKGLLFLKPSSAFNDGGHFIDNLLHTLKTSLSTTLSHFYPLSGRLSTTTINENKASCLVYVDCNNSDGAKFIHAALDMTVSDILSPTDVPLVVQSLFDHDRAVNHDGHSLSLLSVKVTELLDGIFIGCSFNHCIGDGTSYWNFFNVWSEIFQAQPCDGDVLISRQPILERWFPDGFGPVLHLPFTHPDQFITRYEAPELRERFFHFSKESIAKLKAKANAEHDTNKISSFQSLSALVWRSITRSRGLPRDQSTSCFMAANNRTRLQPPLSDNYFGNAIMTLKTDATAGELLQRSLGWAAWKLHEAVGNSTNKMIRNSFEKWVQRPYTYQIDEFFEPCSVMMGSSPRFNMYGNEFGMGKAMGIRSGYANKLDGKVSSYPGKEGGGSVDLEICLIPTVMTILESDSEFMDAVTIT